MWRIRPVETEDVAAAGLDPKWAVASGTDTHLLGVFDGDTLKAGARLVPLRRSRRSHVGVVTVEVRDDDAAELVLDAVVRFADRWTNLDRLELDVRADTAAAAAAPSAGFAREVVRVARCEDGGDELGFGRIRPGFVPRLPGPLGVVAEPAAPPAGEVVVRPMTDDDVAPLAALSVTASVVWGTLQTPTSNLGFYLERRASSDPRSHAIGVFVDGVLAANGALLPAEIPGVWHLGMMVGHEFQGRRLGGVVLDALIAHGTAESARRIELGVWVDNARALALYRSRGFEVEGELRYDGLRDGGHASSLQMVRTGPRVP